MEAVNTKELKPKAARELAGKLQARCYQLENALDDLMRAVEIAQYTKQYTATEVFVREAEDLLKDRITLPDVNPGDTKFTIVESTEEGLEKALDIYNEDPTIEKRKHGDIIGTVDQDGKSHVDIKREKKRGNIHDAKA
jgi:hypothetical protein